MYQSFIFYIIVILIYSARPETGSAFFTQNQNLVLITAIVLIFYAIVHKSCKTISLKTLNQFPEQLTKSYDRLLLRLQTGALLVFTTMVYGFDLGNLIASLPLFKSSEGLNSFAGLAIFMLLQTIIWRENHRYFAENIILINPLSKYIKARLRFALGLMAPWLILLLIFDILNLLLPESVALFQKNPTIEIAAFAIFLLILTLLAPPLLVYCWNCQKFPESPLRQEIITLCEKQNVGFREILLWPSFEGRMATAAVVGAFPCSRYILITPELTQLLNGAEVIAVTSHELGHVRYRHLFYFLLFFLTFFLFNYLYYDLGSAWLLTTSPIISILENQSISPEIFLSAINTIPLMLLYFIFFRYIFGFFLRNFERQADLASLDTPNFGRELISAFTKLGYFLGATATKPNWHHFNIPQRVGFLQTSIQNNAIAKQHHRFVKRSILLYIAVFSIITIPGIYWQQNNLIEKLHTRHLSLRLEHILQKDQNKPELWFLLSSLYIEINDENRALKSLRKAYELSPENPEILNNYAWLLLTCKDKNSRDYSRALGLAQKAVSQTPAPHILDTLAEAYWHTGKQKEAVAIAERILQEQPAPERTNYYRSQLEKFKESPP